MKEKELTNKQVKMFWAKAPDLSKAKVKSSLIHRGFNQEPIITDENILELSKVIPQKINNEINLFDLL